MSLEDTVLQGFVDDLEDIIKKLNRVEQDQRLFASAVVQTFKEAGFKIKLPDTTNDYAELGKTLEVPQEPSPVPEMTQATRPLHFGKQATGQGRDGDPGSVPGRTIDVDNKYIKH